MLIVLGILSLIILLILIAFDTIEIKKQCLIN